MKTKIEISGYEIEIEMHENSISIKAEKDNEVVEEISLPLGEESEEDESEDSDDIKAFSDMEDELEDELEEEDFEDLPMGDEDMEDESEDDDSGEDKLESFQSYFNKPKKKKKVNESIDLDPQTIEMIASFLGPLVVGGTAVAIDKALKGLKSGKAGKIGKSLAKHLEEIGAGASEGRRKGQSKGQA